MQGQRRKSAASKTGWLSLHGTEISDHSSICSAVSSVPGGPRGLVCARQSFLAPSVGRSETCVIYQSRRLSFYQHHPALLKKTAQCPYRQAAPRVEPILLVKIKIALAAVRSPLLLQKTCIRFPALTAGSLQLQIKLWGGVVPSGAPAHTYTYPDTVTNT